MSQERKPQFQIGQKYMSRGKHPHICTVTDIYTTRNNAGEVVKIGYVSTHEFCGGIVTDYDVCQVTIARNAIS